MDVVFAIFMLLIAVVVAGWVISVLARKHVYAMTTLSPERAAEACDRKFSRLAWRRADGQGDLNYQARGIAIGGATPPVMSIKIGIDDISGFTAVEFWMSEWTTRYGMVNHIEKVFWKRWSIPKALRDAEAAASIGSPVAAPPAAGVPVAPTRFATTQPAPQSSGQRKAAADDRDVTLPDPGRPENDLKQLGYQLFKACGLTYLTWGALPLEQHLQAVLQQIPGMRNATVNSVGGGTQGSQDNPDGMWMAYDGPQGSVLAYHVMQSNDFVLHDVAMRLPLITDPVKWGIATVGAEVPAGVAQILAGARAVPLWELSAFAGQRSADESLDVPPTLASGLLALGWTQVDNDNGFRLDVPLNRGGTQAVFFTPYDAQSFAVVAPLDSSVNGAIPEALRGRTFRHYSLEVIADMIVLCERFPAGPPAPDPGAVTAAGRAVTLYAEQQFAGPTPAQAYQSPAPVSPWASTAYPVAGGSIPPGFSYPPPAAANPSPAPASAYSTVPADRAGALAPTTRFGGLTPRHWTILAAAVVAVLVVVGAVNAFSGSPDKHTTTTPGGGANESNVSVDEVSPCSSPPTLTTQSTRFDSGGLSVTTRISSSCSGGDLLSNSRFRVTAVDSSGRDVASGIFDVASDPIAVGSNGTTATFTFPAGTYWRTEDAISGDLQLTAYPEGSDSSVRTGAQSASTLRAASTGTPESGNLEAAAQSALVDIAAADRAYIETNLVNQWQPQLSSKYPGLHADGITWSASDIVREHMELRQRFPQSRLVWSPEWSVYRSDPQWWITLSGIPFSTGDAANGWCTSQGFDRDHCYAKMLSHTLGTSDTTQFR
ncbi:hypothetical protein MycrhDRAFT_5555 [Mycolicibacterium rhodesiae JS60]|nr:hypothetical protein MycrhDRAFT_5555 [Mycolicibacterium rhodesiae JS60]